jgi:hypothetical protein
MPTARVEFCAPARAAGALLPEFAMKPPNGDEHRARAAGASFAEAIADMRRFCASLLALLALSPFTAPFATCDLGTLLNHGTSTPIARATVSRIDAAATAIDGDAGAVIDTARGIAALRSRRLPVAAHAPGAGARPPAQPPVCSARFLDQQSYPRAGILRI